MDYEKCCLFVVFVRYRASSSNTLWQFQEWNMQSLRFTHIWTCFNSIGKLHGFMHMLDAVLVHKSWCNSMKRIVAVVKVCFSTCYVFNTFHKCLVGFVMPGCINHAVAWGWIQNFHSDRGNSHAEWVWPQEIMMRCWSFDTCLCIPSASVAPREKHL